MANEIIKNEVVNENTTNVNENEANDIETIELITLEEFKGKVYFENTISTIEKKSIIDLVIKNCVYKDNGIYYIDYLMRDIILNLCMIDYYTDFNMGNLSYDYLNESGIVNYVKENLHSSDFNSLQKIIVNELEQRVNYLNSIGTVIIRKLSDIIDNIPDISELKDLMGNLPNVLNNLNPAVVSAFANDLHNGKVINNKRDSEKIYDFNAIKEIIDKNNSKENKEDKE